MSAVERKEIENMAKEARIAERDIAAVVDMEMRMKMVRNGIEQNYMLVCDCTAVFCNSFNFTKTKKLIQFVCVF